MEQRFKDYEFEICYSEYAMKGQDLMWNVLFG
jgi:hypothetical protein